MSRHPKAAANSSERAVLPVNRPHAYEWIGLALVLVTTFLVYLPALPGGLLVDDVGNITPSKLRPLSGLKVIWLEPTATAQYYPLLHTVYWIEHRLWGDSYVGYHLVTLLWHAVNVVLLYFVLKRLQVPGALLAAAIFALHPVMVESVAWMCEQKNTLSTLFYLSAMLTYLKFDESRRRSQYFLALALFAMALLTKTITVTLPAALLVIFWWQRGTLSWRRDVAPLVPFFVVGAAAGLGTILVERTYYRADDAEFALTFAQRFLVAGRAIWFYLSKLAWPVNLMFSYPRWTVDPTQWWQWIFPIAVIATTLVLWAIRKHARFPLAVWLLFCGTLFPVLGFENINMFVMSFVADHMQYLASLGIFALAAAVVSLGLARLPQPKRRMGAALCILVLATLAVLARRESRLYGNVETFYRTTIVRNSNSWGAYNNLGLEMSTQGKPQEALEYYRAAVRIKPNFALGHRNIGSVLLEEGRHSEAISEFQTSLALGPNDPHALAGLGFALIESNRPAEAIEPLQRAIKIDPVFALAHNRLGIALGKTGNTSQAIEAFRRALAIDKDYADAHNNWGIVLYQVGQKSEAIEQFRKALQLNQNNFNNQNNLAALLAETDQAEEATAHYQEAIRLNPKSPDAHSGLGDALRQLGRHQEAIEYYRTALRLKSDFVTAYSGLAKSLALVNQPHEAIEIARKGIEIARSTGQQAKAEQLEVWLKHHQAESQPSSSVNKPPQAP